MQDARIDLSLDDAAFTRLCAEQIAPSLRDRVAEDNAVAASYNRRNAWALLAAPVLGITVAIATKQAIVGLFAGVAAFSLLQRVALAPLNASAETTRARTLGAFAKAIGCVFERECPPPDFYQRLLDLWLLPQAPTASFQDRFWGRHNGQDFAFCTARLERPDDRQQRTWFDGFLVRVAFPKKFLGTTIIRRDAGALGNWFEEGRVREKFQTAYLGSTEVDQAFEVYTTDQTEARHLADFAFLERLVELEHLFDEQDIRFAFDGGDLLIAVERARPQRKRDDEPAAPDHLFRRIFVYETYRKAGVSVDAKTAEEIEQALTKDDPPPKPKSEPDQFEPIRAATADTRQILRLIAKVLESAS
jgi:hypothetical protein